MANRVVVTGMGAITPLGNSVETFWEGLKKGKAATAPITKFDASGFKVKLACEVKDFDPQNYMDFKTMKRMEPFAHYALAAAKEAIEQAGLDMEKEDPYRVGVIVSSGIGSMQAHEREQIRFEKSGKIAPMYIPMMIANMASANIAIQYGMKGINTCVVTACATGLHSIGDAFKAVKYGDADVMITGGCEAAVCKTGIQGFAALTALSTNEDPETASRPFDKDRDGFVIGEGSGV
ncbi:MAG: beta-ketoacyl-[Clostridiales bacterium]|nr:beta-ketoacyl-[acyl-carrier-protein] synthase II [Clostridiales bacterium]